MTVFVLHAGHQVHGPGGIAISDIGFVVILAGFVFAAWRVTENPGTWRLRFALLAMGLLALAISIAPVIDRAAVETFRAHMVEHLLMMLVAAPLIATSRPDLLLMRALARRRRRFAVAAGHVEAVLRGPAVLAGLFVFTALWLWHIPQLFDAAVQSEPVHLLQHASFLGAAIVFWRFVLLLPSHGTRFFLPRAALVFVSMLYTGVLGALLVFSDDVWYASYEGTGASRLADQQAAGLLMWLSGIPLYLGVLGWLVVAWLRRDEREASIVRPVSPAGPSTVRHDTQGAAQ